MILIAGPCVIEHKDILRESVESLLEATRDKNIQLYFKSSFMKDNRSLSSSFNVVDEGSEAAIRMLKDIKKEYNVQICTDFHSVDQISTLAANIDIIQIPAFLAKQQSILTSASKAAQIFGSSVFVKKPQFIPPTEIRSIKELLVETGLDNNRVLFADRGTMLGYSNYFMDPRHVDIMHKSGANTVIADITHPQKNYFPDISDLHTSILNTGLAYLSAGADGIFLETHPDCKNALCDANTMLQSDKLKKYISKFYNLYKFIQEEL